MQAEIVDVYQSYTTTGTNPWDYKVAAHDLPYQVGSLTKLIMQLSGDRYADGKTKETLIEGVKDELADILAEILFIAHELGIDIEEAWKGMVKSDEDKISSRT